MTSQVLANRSPLQPRALPGLVACVRNALRSVWTYRIDMVMGLASLLVQVYLLMVVWRAVYGSSATVQGITQRQAISYAALASCLQAALMPWQFSSLLQRVRTGQVGIDLMRPLGLIPQVLAQNVGTMVGRLPITIVGLGWAVAIGALSLPPHPSTVVLWLVATVLGVVLMLLMNQLMSMLAFWSLEIGGYLMLYRLGSGLLSGVLIPLWFMPGWLRTTLDWLPFRAQMFTPLSIYFGQTHGTAAWLAIATQVGWIAVVSLVLWLVWRLAVHKVVVLGG